MNLRERFQITIKTFGIMLRESSLFHSIITYGGKDFLAILCLRRNKHIYAWNF